jgi:hypothetical protein
LNEKVRQAVLNVLDILDFNGMSGDETDPESATKHLRKVKLDFRAPQVTKLLHTLDTYPTRLLRSSRGGRGNRALPMILDAILADTDPKDVPSQWPINYYDPDWLNRKSCSAPGVLLSSAAKDLPVLVSISILHFC